MSARELRNAIKEGRYTRKYMKAPDPPEQLSAGRKHRMNVSIAAAILFISQGKTADQILVILNSKNVVGKVTKQRVSQYVNKGVEYLLDKGMYGPVGEDRGL
jgi:hypothetical protein